MNKSRIFITGDTHSDLKRFSSSNFPEGKELTKNDVIFQLGDFGAIWNNQEEDYEKYWMNWLADKPWTTIVILGNHEGYDRIMQLPEESIHGAKAWTYIADSGNRVYFIKAGEILTINDRSFLCIRGALSIDKHLRTEGKDYWPQELLSKEEENHVLDKLDEVGWKVDYVLTHTCPDSCIYYCIDGMSEKFRDPVAHFLEFIANRLEFKHWMFGHFHNNRVFTDQSGDSYECLYHTIKELEVEDE